MKEKELTTLEHCLNAPSIHVGAKSGAKNLCRGQRVKRYLTLACTLETFNSSTDFCPHFQDLWLPWCDNVLFWVNWLGKWFWKVLGFVYFTCNLGTFDFHSHSWDPWHLHILSPTLLRHSIPAPIQCIMLLSNVDGGVVKKNKSSIMKIFLNSNVLSLKVQYEL